MLDELFIVEVCKVILTHGVLQQVLDLNFRKRFGSWGYLPQCRINGLADDLGGQVTLLKSVFHFQLHN